MASLTLSYDSALQMRSMLKWCCPCSPKSSRARCPCGLSQHTRIKRPAEKECTALSHACFLPAKLLQFSKSESCLDSENSPPPERRHIKAPSLIPTASPKLVNVTVSAPVSSWRKPGGDYQMEMVAASTHCLWGLLNMEEASASISPKGTWSFQECATQFKASAAQR